MAPKNKKDDLRLIVNNTILNKRLAATHSVEFNPKTLDLTELKLSATNVLRSENRVVKLPQQPRVARSYQVLAIRYYAQ